MPELLIRIEDGAPVANGMTLETARRVKFERPSLIEPDADDDAAFDLSTLLLVFAGAFEAGEPAPLELVNRAGLWILTSIGQGWYRYEPSADGVWWVSVYSTSQHYGGPEEGGWYYDRWVLQRSIPCQTEVLARQMARMLDARRPAREDRAHLIPEGESPYGDTEGYIPTGFAMDADSTVIVERNPGDHQMTERPRYE